MKKINDKEYLEIVKFILENDEFLKRKKYKHHGNISVYDHCLKVSYVSYKYAKKFGLNKYDAAIGGLLHDFYYKPWTESVEKKNFFEKHGFVHARDALENSRIHFKDNLNSVREDIILKHMFPLNIKIPKYRETWLIVIVDKCVSMEVLLQPKFFKDMFK